MPNHTNVFNYANPNGIDNPSGGVTLSIDNTSGVRRENIGSLELFNDTTINVSVSGTVLLPQGIDAVLQPGCAMQLQSVGVGKVAVTGTGTSITNHTTDSTPESLIKSTKDGVTKLMQLKGAGTVTIKEDP